MDACCKRKCAGGPAEGRKSRNKPAKGRKKGERWKIAVIKEENVESRGRPTTSMKVGKVGNSRQKVGQ